MRLRFGEETFLEDPDKGGEHSTHRPFFVQNSMIKSYARLTGLLGVLILDWSAMCFLVGR